MLSLLGIVVAYSINKVNLQDILKKHYEKKYRSILVLIMMLLFLQAQKKWSLEDCIRYAGKQPYCQTAGLG